LALGRAEEGAEQHQRQAYQCADFHAIGQGCQEQSGAYAMKRFFVIDPPAK
jgi:hypothetical protein